MSIYDELFEPEQVLVVSMADVRRQDVRFLYDPYIPSGKISVGKKV